MAQYLLIPFKKNGKHRIINASGWIDFDWAEVQHPKIYGLGARAHFKERFVHDYYPVIRDGKVGLVSFKGDEPIAFKYDTIYTYEAGSIVSWIDNEFDLYDNNVKLRYSGTQEAYVGFNKDEILFRNGDQLSGIDTVTFELHTPPLSLDTLDANLIKSTFAGWGMVNNEGEILLPFEYYQSRQMRHAIRYGGYLLNNEEGPNLYNSKGEKLLEDGYDYIEPAGTKPYFVVTKDFDYGIYNLETKSLIPLSSFKNSITVTGYDGSAYQPILPYYVIQRKNAQGSWENALISSANEMIHDWTTQPMSYYPRDGERNVKDYQFVKPDGKACIIYDYLLNKVATVDADYFVTETEENLLFVKDNKLIEVENQGFNPSPALSFVAGKSRAIETVDHLYGLVDADLNVVAPFTYPYLGRLGGFGSDLYQFTTTVDYGSTGIMDSAGTILLEPIYYAIARPDREFKNFILVLKEEGACWTFGWWNEKSHSIELDDEYCVADSYPSASTAEYIQFKLPNEKYAYVYRNGKVKVKSE